MQNAKRHATEQGSGAAVEKLLEERLHVKEVLERLHSHMRTRNAELSVSELTLLDRVARQDITLLNPMTRKLHVAFMSLMNSTMQLECKMGRRGLFLLRTRQRRLEERLRVLEERLTEAGVSGEQVPGGVGEGAEPSEPG